MRNLYSTLPITIEFPSPPSTSFQLNYNRIPTELRCIQSRRDDIIIENNEIDNQNPEGVIQPIEMSHLRRLFFLSMPLLSRCRPAGALFTQDPISTIIPSLRDFNNVLKQYRNAIIKNPQLPQLGFLLLHDTTDNSQLPQLFDFLHWITPPKTKRDPETSSGWPSFYDILEPHNSSLYRHAELVSASSP